VKVYIVYECESSTLRGGVSPAELAEEALLRAEGHDPQRPAGKRVEVAKFFTRRDAEEHARTRPVGTSRFEVEEREERPEDQHPAHAGVSTPVVAERKLSVVADEDEYAGSPVVEVEVEVGEG
jgi:hypothetical protein